jgi:hypothetical protein
MALNKTHITCMETARAPVPAVEAALLLLLLLLLLWLWLLPLLLPLVLPAELFGAPPFVIHS